jgi:RNA polymerase sigma-70 factor (ECF subfamily)
VAAESAPPDRDETTDADLLAAHVAGDREAFGVLFARHRDRLWAVALRTTGDPERAADGLQDGLVAAFRRAHTFRGDARVTTWLHRVVVNACLDRLRSERVRSADPLPDDLDDDRSGHTVADPAPGPDERSLAADRRRQVLAALHTLPPEQRAALVLVDMEGYAVAEAAEILECPVGTVKSRCARGRARVAPLLRPLLTASSDDETPVMSADGNPVDGPDVGSVSRRGPPDPGRSTA